MPSLSESQSSTAVRPSIGSTRTALYLRVDAGHCRDVTMTARPSRLMRPPPTVETHGQAETARLATSAGSEVAPAMPVASEMAEALA